MNKYQELIFRKNPHCIFTTTIILTIILLTLITISCFYKYNKYYYFNGIKNEEGGNNCVNILVPHDEVDIIKNNDLIIDKKKIGFSYEITSDYYNDSNKIYNNVIMHIDTNIDDNVVKLVFESSKTTFMKEIINKIKKGMIQ